MKLKLEREHFNTSATTGSLYVGRDFQCYTLEDKDRRLEDGGTKIPGATAIPRGTYEVIIDWSNRFKRELPRLLDVPGFVGVRIHSGNSAADTEGCILVGSTRTDVWVRNSRATFNSLFEKLTKAYEKGEQIMIEIV